ncbi:MAG: FAD-binding protein, partial [Kiritimatiellae bacterium]|nr:FAD-binding protein [Kiritimatiellia bacterium]
MVDALVIGSGAAGLAAAARLKAEGVKDVLVLTESLKGGTSINTGSDKQTYYKLGLCGEEPDSPVRMARTYLESGAVHGDIALVESALSARCFSHLCDIGVPFPHDAFGQYAGYKTDHDPARRATSIGPYTSREMCLRLLDECRMRGVRFAEGFVAVQLLVAPAPPPASSRPLRCFGALAIPVSGGAGGIAPLPFVARDTILAVGGPGGLYSRSVYPSVHLGGIGLALAAGARARNLPLSQFGLASIGFRWNVSGTYMQVLPRFISTAADGESDPRDFLLPAFGGDPAAAASEVFLKGYEWPFDAEKAASGSSRIDLLVREETIGKGRRVFLDYRSDTPGLGLSSLSPEARAYLEKSGALAGPPIARLLHMNPGAAALYREHGTDLAAAPLEIALCAQHNNGGLAADCWWQSENVAHLWPVGEVNGSHGVRRPGGSALNAAQVGAFRAAAAIAHSQREAVSSLPPASFAAAVPSAALLTPLLRGSRDWRADRRALQARMDAAAGPVRTAGALSQAAAGA